LLCAGHGVFLSYAVSVLLVLRFDSLQVLRLVLGPLQLPRETFELIGKLSFCLVKLLFQIEDFLTIGVSFALIKLLELFDIFTGVIILLKVLRGGKGRQTDWHGG
jgi:hypothetical protein